MKGGEACRHSGPSTIDFRTLARSWPLPPAFLRGVGLPDNVIKSLTSLLNDPQFYSCFISHSSVDQPFAKKLYADLQSNDVLCWYAPENMKIGDPIRDTIAQAIRVREKLLIILSAASIQSAWVEDEVEEALEEERKSQGQRMILFPIKIDQAVEDTDRAWVRKIKRTRHIGDFTQWKDHDSYQKALTRLLRDLKTATEKTTTSDG